MEEKQQNAFTPQSKPLELLGGSGAYAIFCLDYCSATNVKFTKFLNTVIIGVILSLLILLIRFGAVTLATLRSNELVKELH